MTPQLLTMEESRPKLEELGLVVGSSEWHDHNVYTDKLQLHRGRCVRLNPVVIDSLTTTWLFVCCMEGIIHRHNPSASVVCHFRRHSTVWSATNMRNGALTVLKAYECNKLRHRQVQNVFREIRLLSRLNTGR